MLEKESLILKLERGRAEFAYDCVKQAIDILKTDEKEKKNYRSYVRKIPHMILTNGLGQTLAFVCSKKKDGNAYELIYNQITEYFKSDTPARIKMPEGKNELIEWVISLDTYSYRYVAEEILAFLGWVKKFAEGMIKTREEE